MTHDQAQLLPEPSFDDVRPLHAACDHFRTSDTGDPSPSMRACARELVIEAEKLATMWVELVDTLADYKGDLVVLREQRDELQEELGETQRELDKVYSSHCEGCGMDDALAEIVRQVHDESHTEPWTVCSNRACRAAAC